MPNLNCTSLDSNSLKSLASASIFSVLDFFEADVEKIASNSALTVEAILSLKHEFITEYSACPLKGDVVYIRQRDDRFVKTQILGLDTLLDGGLRRGSLLELCGPSSSGKTQICLTLAVNLAAAGMRVDYVDTKRDFSPSRCNSLLPPNLPDEDMDRILENIYVHNPRDIYQLISTLTSIKSKLKSDKENRLLIVDSVTAPYLPFVGLSTNKGLSLLNHIASSLKSLATDHRLPVVMTNLGVRYFEADEDNLSNLRDPNEMKPLLGKYWSHVPNTRVAVSRDGQSSPTSRTVVVHKSDYLRLKKSTKINITENGVT